MKEKIIVSIDDYEKLVTDLLLYIEKETDIQFKYDTAGGMSVMITIESCNPNNPSIRSPAEVYQLDSYNGCVRFVFYVCDWDGRRTIIEIALLPFISKSDEAFIKATKNLTEILPNIPITHHLRETEVDYC